MDRRNDAASFSIPEIHSIHESQPYVLLMFPNAQVKDKFQHSAGSKILGTIPIEKDGSFQVRVPAMTPLRFQLLDEDQNVLRSQRAWTWVMGNENRGCIGCHENRELSPPNIIVDAVTKAPQELIKSD